MRSPVSDSEPGENVCVPMYFGPPEARVFGWLHRPAGASRGCGLVLCSPLGYEGTVTHRSYRHVAERACAAGFPALRFDYPGTGDSSGADQTAGRVRAWIDSVRQAVDALRAHTGVERVGLIGVRFGGTLAVMAAGEIEVDAVMVWAPCVSGKRYVREMRALAMGAQIGSAANAGGARDGDIEAAGAVLAADTVQALREIDLTRVAVMGTPRFYVGTRDDFPDDGGLPDHLRSLGLPVEVAALDGYAGMMAEPHYTMVPTSAIERFVAWAGEAFPRGDGPVAPSVVPESVLRGTTEHGAMYRERPVRFGAGNGLFGILCEPDDDSVRSERCVVLLNAGSVHRTGPNRMYVDWARRWVAFGLRTLRFDVGGIGDSRCPPEARENDPYAPHALDDVRTALEWLRSATPSREFVVMGLCSGAFLAFHAGLRLEGVHEAVLINPLTFYWRHGMSLETPPSRHYEEMRYFKHAAGRVDSWKKLLRGQVNVRYVLRLGAERARIVVAARLGALRRAVGRRNAQDDLAGDLMEYPKRRVALRFVFAEGDPGHDLLMTHARSAVRRLLRSDAARLDVIEAADHTFTPRQARNELTDRLTRLMQSPRG